MTVTRQVHQSSKYAPETTQVHLMHKVTRNPCLNPRDLMPRWSQMNDETLHGVPSPVGKSPGRLNATMIQKRTLSNAYHICIAFLT
ncbi:hypothetical protein AGABI2DRAFT_193177 [Agaricus bisporus var. bisporus H97]|uniref:hypothetical protein n=1 Tax=Agaricus bisporus var. bisporus (strain H97 / ATCC MYA-4626 / FGSC 10389) TaxID=936046 RepID=UPI00029F5BA6|nr:hypothetical protein AGABI2DRAFT_193177 [Agaricus bisporus var. bisporus H97]EKV46469.1 hypothetical protein AGABI2DRAFT_193177 [Agaricus bisporus var. bisporus H97]